MNKAKSLFYGIIAAYIPLLFIVPAVMYDSGGWFSGYWFYLYAAAFLTACPFVAFADIGGILFCIFDGGMRLSEMIILAVRVLLSLAALTTYVFALAAENDAIFISFVLAVIVVVLWIVSAVIGRSWSRARAILCSKVFWLTLITLVFTVSAVFAVDNLIRDRIDKIDDIEYPVHVDDLEADLGYRYKDIYITRIILHEADGKYYINVQGAYAPEDKYNFKDINEDFEVSAEDYLVLLRESNNGALINACGEAAYPDMRMNMSLKAAAIVKDAMRD